MLFLSVVKSGGKVTGKKSCEKKEKRKENQSLNESLPCLAFEECSVCCYSLWPTQRTLGSAKLISAGDEINRTEIHHINWTRRKIAQFCAALGAKDEWGSLFCSTKRALNAQLLLVQNIGVVFFESDAANLMLRDSRAKASPKP